MAEEKTKVVMVGDFSTGKTCLLIRLSQNIYDSQHNPTIGASFLKQVIETEDGKREEINLWDTSGDERYRSVMPIYFRGSSCAIIVYDVTRRDTFESLDYWIELTKKSAPKNIGIVIVGSKCDLEKAVTDAEAKEYCQRVGCPLVLCSSKTGENVLKVFQTAVRCCYNTKSVEPKVVNINDKKSSNDKDGCC